MVGTLLEFVLVTFGLFTILGFFSLLMSFVQMFLEKWIGFD